MKDECFPRNTINRALIENLSKQELKQFIVNLVRNGIGVEEAMEIKDILWKEKK